MRRHSPYNYAFDNPMRFIDPDGMAPTPPDIITIISNANNTNNLYQTKDVAVRMTLTVVNTTGADLSKTMFSSDKGTVDLTSTFGGLGESRNPTGDGNLRDNEYNITSVNVDYKVVSSLNDVGKNDHVMVIAGNVPTLKGETGDKAGRAVLGGRVSAVEGGTTKDGSFNKTAIHEIGHNLGLVHKGNGLMSEGQIGQGVDAKQKGQVMTTQNANAYGNGTHKQSDSYSGQNIQKIVTDFLKTNGIK